MQEQEIYAAIGHEGFTRLIAAFYRQIPEDTILGPMYKGRDLKAAEARLRDFLIYRFGGPDSYIQERGHPRLRMRHGPFAIDEAARNRWMELMRKALAEAQFAPEVEEALIPYLDNTATFMINRS
jgi:hemoglobin